MGFWWKQFSVGFHRRMRKRIRWFLNYVLVFECGVCRELVGSWSLSCNPFSGQVLVMIFLSLVRKEEEWRRNFVEMGITRKKSRWNYEKQKFIVWYEIMPKKYEAGLQLKFINLIFVYSKDLILWNLKSNTWRWEIRVKKTKTGPPRILFLKMEKIFRVKPIHVS